MSGTNCDHKWNFQYLIYWPDENTLTGSGAHSMHYADMFYCEKCLEQKYINDRIIGNDYNKILSGAILR